MFSPICLAQFMVVLDSTIVNVALPSIQKDLNLSEASLQWIVTAYTLASAGSRSWAVAPATFSAANASSWSGS